MNNQPIIFPKPTDPFYQCDIFDEFDYARKSFVFAEGVSRCLDDSKTKLNNNVVVVGTSGCGKTTGFVEPNLMETAGNYIVSDPKGVLCRKYGQYLQNKGYAVYQLDFQHPDKSMHWNPLVHVRNTQDIMRIANVLAAEEVSLKLDPYWDKMTVLLICAIIAYMQETNYQPRNLHSILELLREGDRHERKVGIGAERYTDTKSSRLSDRFERLHLQNPDSWAYQQFANVDTTPDKTYDCIRSTLASKFAQFDTKEIEQMMSSNEIDFREIAENKSVVFVMQSDCDRSMDTLVNLFMTQAIQAFYEIADGYADHRLPIPMRFFLDDYGATTVINHLDCIISTIRSRGISVSLILQSEAQLMKGKSGDDKTILANCDTYIYMGGNDVETAKSVSQRCNKPLEQVLYMPVGYCWVFERGKKPVFAKVSARPELRKDIEYDR